MRKFGDWDTGEMEDPDDPMVVRDIPCTICGAEVDVDGYCERGHNDLDRALAAREAAAGDDGDERR